MLVTLTRFNAILSGDQTVFRQILTWIPWDVAFKLFYHVFKYRLTHSAQRLDNIKSAMIQRCTACVNRKRWGHIQPAALIQDCYSASSMISL